MGAPLGKLGWPVTGEGFSVLLYNEAISTSGNEEQFGHIMNPKTGSSADGVIATSVVSQTAPESDALSTAAFVVGAKNFSPLPYRPKRF